MTSALKRALSALTVLVFFAFLAPASVGAQFNPVQEACDQANASNAPACQRQNTNDNPVAETIKRVTTIVASVAGIVAVLMIIFFGFQFVSSAGDSQKAKSARMGIIYSAVGLAVIALSVPLINIILSLIG